MTVRAFTLVLAGGGARGYAHVGVLRALEHLGMTPAGIVGVSMGAIVAATYALRDDWYEALEAIDVGGAPPPRPRLTRSPSGHGPRRTWRRARTAWNLVTGWGAPDDTADAAREVITRLLGEARLEEGRLPVVVCASDLVSGARVEFSDGPAASAVYASSALAGVLPPSERGGRLLADGAYTDVAPIDVARAMGPSIVIAVDPSQQEKAGSIRNGLQAVVRAMEICYVHHALLRLETADLVLKPDFGGYVDTLDFGARRRCIAAGCRVVRRAARPIRSVLRASA
jgi:NTE family protein